MEDLLQWRFILFGLACGGLVYLQFFLAHREWRRLKGVQALDIDLEYVRMEDCLPQSFRAKVRDWIQLPSSRGESSGERIIPHGREQIRLTGPLSVGPGKSISEVLIVEGDFSCGERCQITREVWAKGDAVVGRGSRLQAIASDGILTIQDDVSVTRWADSEGEMSVGERCRIGARATSRKAVRLGLWARVLSAYAPEVSTSGWDGSMAGGLQVEDEKLLEIGPPEGPGLPARLLKAAGIDPSMLAQLSPECWSYLGDFRPRVPIRLGAGLVVKGQCDLPGGSVLAGDVKAHGRLIVGPSSVCDGNLVAGTDIWLGQGCRFSGVIHAEGSVLLGSGTRGAAKKEMVAVYAGEDLCVELNVWVAGKLASGAKVVAVDAAQAEKWRIDRMAEEK